MQMITGSRSRLDCVDAVDHVFLAVMEVQLAHLRTLERVGKRAFPTRAGEILLAHATRAFRDWWRTSSMSGS